MLNAKMRKLIRDPNLFFSDMVKKKRKKIGAYKTKEIGEYQYTVVSAVYNVGRYLEDFFKSITTQRLDFNQHIHLVLVDDGSTDDSAEIIKSWVNKYPKNIKYIWQENAGQSVARNTGLEYVDTEWVTFIDPDDFLNDDYFLSIDKFLSKNKDKKVNLIASNIVMYIETKDAYRYTHPLSFKFKEGNKLVELSKMSNELQLSASSAFFRHSIIHEDQITFDSRVKPNFEDAHFISKYLLNNSDGHLLLMKDAEYFYRKREDGTSTLDTSWTKPERFINVPEFGYLDTLKMYHDVYGKVPVNIQKTILYETLWYIKWLDNRPERTHFLSDIEKNNFISKMREAFTYIDNTTIMSFNLAGAWFYHKLAMISFFKDTMPSFQIIYADRYDAAKDLVRIKYFTDKVNIEQFLLDGKDTPPAYTKTIEHEFVGKVLVTERLIWLSVKNIKKLKVVVNGLVSTISVGSKQYKEEAPASDIISLLKKQIPKYQSKSKYQNSWILMDRDMHADDNAEHLYRYIRDKYPEKKIFYALRKESHDWERLSADHFNLLEFDSAEHRSALGGCSKVISSQANYYVTNLLGPDMLRGRHFVFLQHGVIKDDLSGWLNTKESIDCFITSSPREYESICGKNTKYNYSAKETFLTGLPRHDNLVINKNKSEKLIVIMPTWRSGIVGPILGDGDSRGINPNFMDSDYAIHWKELLHSERLRELSLNSGYKIAFFPHVNIFSYLELFDIPEYIDVITHADGSIQDLFIHASLMITDYSSVAFEMAIQNKQTLYYQFDEEDFFAGHNYTKGYFDYRKDGFGPVVNTLDGLLDELEVCLSNGCEPNAAIIKNINDTFPVRDSNNCERTYKAIVSLDEPLSDDYVNIDELKTSAIQASCLFQWRLAEGRWQSYLDAIGGYADKDVFYLIESLIRQGKINLAFNILSESNLVENDLSIINSKCNALLAMGINDWDAAIDEWKLAKQDNINCLDYCQCLCFSHKTDELNILAKDASESPELIEFFILFSEGKMNEAISMLDDDFFEKYSKIYPRYLLMASAACREENLLVDSNDYLVKYESLISDDPQCRFEIIRLAALNNNWVKVVKQISTLRKHSSQLPIDIIEIYLEALSNQNNNKLIDHELKELAENGLYSRPTAQLISYFARQADAKHLWEHSTVRWNLFFQYAADVSSEERTGYFYSLLKQGRLSEADVYLNEAILLYEGQDLEVLIEARALLYMTRLDWELALSEFIFIGRSDSNNIGYCECLRHLHRVNELEALYDSLETESFYLRFCVLYAKREYENIRELYLENNIDSDYLAEYPSLLLIVADAHRELKLIDDATAYLLSYERLVPNDPQCRYVIARLAFENELYKKVIKQLKHVCNNIFDLPSEFLMIYFDSLNRSHDIIAVDDFLKECHYVNEKLFIELLERCALYASSIKKWHLAESRWKLIIASSALLNINAEFHYTESLIYQGRLEEASKKISELQLINSTYPELTICIGELQALLLMSKHRWAEAIIIWQSINKADIDNINYLRCLAYDSRYDVLDSLQTGHDSVPASVKVYSLYAHQNWVEVIKILQSTDIDLFSEDSIANRLLILKASAYRQLGLMDDAQNCLINYESKIVNDPECRCEIARISFLNGKWLKVISQLDKAYEHVSSMPKELKFYYLQSLFSLGSLLKMKSVMNSMSPSEFSDPDILRLKAQMLMSLNLWGEAVDVWMALDQHDPDVIYHEALSLKEIGQFKKAYQILMDRPVDTIPAWQLRAELAQLNDDWEEAYKCSLRVQWKNKGEVSISAANIESLVSLKTL